MTTIEVHKVTADALLHGAMRYERDKAAELEWNAADWERRAQELRDAAATHRKNADSLERAIKKLHGKPDEPTALELGAAVRAHASDCATHNEPAEPEKPCDCIVSAE